MNLPARRELPSDVRARMRDRLLAAYRKPTGPQARLRGPLAVAAGVTVLAATATIVAQSTNGASDEETIAAAMPTARSSSTSARPSSTTTEPSTPLPIPPLNPAKAKEDLDRCAAVAAASPRAAEFAPRQAWQPVFAVELNGHRITAYRESGTRPMFCDTTATTATVSDPSAEPMSLSGAPNAPYYGLYLSPAGILAGVAQGVAKLECDVNTLLDYGPGGGFHFRTRKEPVSLKGIQFVVFVGQLKDGDELVSTAYDRAGRPLTSGGMRFEKARVRPVGATAVDRPK
jgi:hypothetical protein